MDTKSEQITLPPNHTQPIPVDHLRISKACGASLQFICGWNDAVSVYASTRRPPSEASEWWPTAYRQGWGNFRALACTFERAQTILPPAHVPEEREPELVTTPVVRRGLWSRLFG